MVDPITEKVAEQGAKSFGAVVDKLLGPTAEIMGQELASWYERRRNVQRVAERAAMRSDLEVEGSVPARLAAELFDKAQWADDEFVAEYLSGVLASGRTAGGSDDSGISWTALVGRLSSTQLALHWIIYTSFQKRIRGHSHEEFWDLISRQIVVDFQVLQSELQRSTSGEVELSRILEAAYGLRREGLLVDLSHGDGGYLSSSVTWTKASQLRSDRVYMTFKVTSDGVELLLHALGEGDQWFAGIMFEDASKAIEESEVSPSQVASVFVDDLRTTRGAGGA
ncbi:MAG: hypothetical protein J7474_00300 [Arthrobacter sp.]|nr:hypothetical protein [Arthrobacter sp.]